VFLPDHIFEGLGAIAQIEGVGHKCK
jgi:hypothetical protein